MSLRPLWDKYYAWRGVAWRGVAETPFEAVSFRHGPDPRQMHFIRGLTTGVVFLALAGCGNREGSTGGKAAGQAEPAQHRPAIIHYNFGGVIDGGTLLSHTYRFVNDRDHRDHRVRVLELVNLKTCCGRVEPVNVRDLMPGEGVDVTVRLDVRGKIGPLQHRAAIRTDADGGETTEIMTMATVFPSSLLRIESSVGSRVAPGERLEIKGEALAHGTKAAPGIDLDRCEVKAATGQVSWAGPAHRESVGDGVDEARRVFTFVDPGSSEPGARSCEVVLSDNDRALAKQVIAWEILESLQASPRSIVLTDRARVTVRSRDGKAFEIRGVESSLACVKARSTSVGGADHHELEIVLDGGKAGNETVGRITVKTNRPDQPVLKVPVFLPTRSAKSAQPVEKSEGGES